MKKTKKQSGPRRAPALPPARGAAAAGERSSAQACGARRSPVERGGGVRCDGGLWAAEACGASAVACGASAVGGRRPPLRWWSAGSSAVAGGGLRCGPQARAAASVAVVERERKRKRDERGETGSWER
jgi:hypothetical protein